MRSEYSMAQTSKKSVTTTIDPETDKSLQLIERTLEIKPAAVARRGLKKIIPELLKQAKAVETK